MNNILFEKWSLEKQKIHMLESGNFFINEREIWFTKMGQNIGYEENGKKNFLRPVLVLKKIGNLFFVSAMTSKGKTNHPFYHKMLSVHLKNPKNINSSYVILSQVKVMDKKRFFENIGSLELHEFNEVKEKPRTLLL